MDIKLQEKIQKNLRRISEPADYFNGMDAKVLPLPESVLLFKRTHSLDYDTGSSHHRFVMIMNFQTEGTVILDNAMFDFKVGQAVIIFPFQYHAYTDFASKKIDWLFCSFEWPRAITPGAFLKLKDTIITIPSDTLGLISRLSQLYTDQTSDPDLCANGVAMLTGAILNDFLLAEEAHSTLRHASKGEISRSRELFQAVSSYIYSNLDKPIQIRDVADYAGISESHLRNVFTDKFNINIGSYIRRSKLIRACRLLETTEMSVSQVADACGFNSVFAFSRTFRQNIGMSPNKYRNRPDSRRKRQMRNKLYEHYESLESE